MNVLVDTSAWSIALRRQENLAESPVKHELAELIQEGRVIMLGPVRQELLCGIKSDVQCVTLRDKLRAFPDVELEHTDYEEAAEAFNQCRRHGIQGSNTDFLLCAVSVRRELSIFTTDKDFERYKQVLDLRLHQPRTR